ncbi:hypothetical protein D3C73_1353110 [compost metagenome]
MRRSRWNWVAHDEGYGPFTADSPVSSLCPGQGIAGPVARNPAEAFFFGRLQIRLVSQTGPGEAAFVRSVHRFCHRFAVSFFENMTVNAAGAAKAWAICENRQRRLADRHDKIA